MMSAAPPIASATAARPVAGASNVTTSGPGLMAILAFDKRKGWPRIETSPPDGILDEAGRRWKQAVRGCMLVDARRPSEEAMGRSPTLDMTVKPTSAALGAEIAGVDLRHVDDPLFARIHRAWVDHQVLLFRSQSLSDAELIGFSRRFGGLDHAPIQETGRRFVEGFPEIYVVSNVMGTDGQPIGSLGAGEAIWHTDMSYLEQPPKASMPYALAVQPAAGYTQF